MNEQPGIAALLVVVSMLVGACGAFDGVRGSGDVATEERAVVGFDGIDLQSSGTVIIELGTAESLTIEAEENLLEHLTADVEGSTLVLGTDRSISPTRDIVYRITAIDLGRLSLSGSGEISLGDVASAGFALELGGSGQISLERVLFETLSVRLSGSGEIHVSGTTQGLDVSLSGSGAFDGEDLIAEMGVVSLSGSGEAIVNVSTDLDATVSGSGSIQYLGDPTLTASTPGSGTIGRR